ncbi:MAG: phosphoglycerate mutase family protein [Acidobacteriota bacterium]
MKLIFAALLGFAIVLAGSADTFSQAKKTIILVRHAEKDAAQVETSGDPDLSSPGRDRAERLATIAGKYRPGAIFSSDTKRTKQTAEPTAKRRHLEVQVYDPGKQPDFVKQIMASKTKRFLIVGHSNTVPGLVNLLVNKELFKSLDESEYGAVWIVRLKRNRPPKVEVVQY